MMTCVHCDEAAITALFNDDDSAHKNPFCCYGCLTVYNIIHDKGLASYYQIKKDAAIFKRRSPVEYKNSKFDYLNDEKFLEEYSHHNIHQERVMEFYLEGIHCLACLWLIEKLPEFLTDVKSSKLDLERSVVTVVLKSQGNFSAVALELNNLGYRPHALKVNQDSVDLKIKEERLTLIRIGVAGAAAGNIMIYAVSLYGGATQEFSSIFNFLTVLFAIPVLTFSAYPLYKNAWQALKHRTVSIDIPISLALVMGAVMGGYNLLVGIPENYFDSLTTLVFLLLLSRYFLHKIQERGLSATDLHFFYQSESVLKAKDDSLTEFIQIHPRYIQVNDVLMIPPGEFIPADGVVVKGSSNLNNSLLTGESYPVKVSCNQNVYSGTQNIDQEIYFKVKKVKNDTRLGGLLKNVEDGQFNRSKTISLTNKISKYFTLSVFGLSFALFIYLFVSHDLKTALEQAMTLLIVTCPCALALATPLTFTRSLSLAARQGIIIKSDEVIESLAKVKNIFLDKTGTVTHGKLKVNNFQLVRKPSLEVEDIIFNLEHNSRHPVAQALMKFVRSKNTRPYLVTDKLEVPGLGVSGYIENSFYEINRHGIFENHLPVARFEVEDTVREDSRKILNQMKHHGLSVSILSGDSLEAVQKISKEVHLNNYRSDLSPEEKSNLIKSTPHTMMVGDGANDALALSSADVGVAVLGAMDISLRAADVYLTTPGLAPVEKLIVLSQETMKVVRRNLVLSLLYNSLSVTAAFMGIISPLVAAIIMPLSSLTVLISTIIGTKKMRDLWKS
jgi:heavy metal translocating P-type ATPase